jgi:large subunit ribosomal protein L35e
VHTVISQKQKAALREAYKKKKKLLLLLKTPAFRRNLTKHKVYTSFSPLNLFTISSSILYSGGI